MSVMTGELAVAVAGGDADTAAVVRPPSTTGLRIGFTLTEIVGNASTNVLRTSVTLVVGETVVVGTSRVRGQGLIAFITAVPSASP
jgi:hypothetical protein